MTTVGFYTFRGINCLHGLPPKRSRSFRDFLYYTRIYVQDAPLRTRIISVYNATSLYPSTLLLLLFVIFLRPKCLRVRYLWLYRCDIIAVLNVYWTIFFFFLFTYPRSCAVGARWQRLKSRHAPKSHVYQLVDRYRFARCCIVFDFRSQVTCKYKKKIHV